MQELVDSIPNPFIKNLGTRRFLLSLSRWSAYFPPGASPRKPWLPHSTHEEGRDLIIAYRVDETDVEYYLGFLDALVAFYEERCFISVRTLRGELIFRCVFES